MDTLQPGRLKNCLRVRLHLRKFLQKIAQKHAQQPVLGDKTQIGLVTVTRDFVYGSAKNFVNVNAT